MLSEIAWRFVYAFRPGAGSGFPRPVLETCAVASGDTVAMAGMDVRLFDQDHGFSRTLGLRIDGFAYSTDVRELDEAAFAALTGVDTWVVGCFQRCGPHATHAHLDRVLGWASRLSPRRTVLTHMGSDMDWAWLTSHLPPGVEPGYDGLTLSCCGDRSPGRGTREDRLLGLNIVDCLIGAGFHCTAHERLPCPSRGCYRLSQRGDVSKGRAQRLGTVRRAGERWRNS